MTPDQSRRFNCRLLKMSLSLQKAAKSDPALQPASKLLDDAWQKLYRLEQARQLEVARRKDKGVVLWEIFFPSSGWFYRRVITCTPNRIIQTSQFSDKVSEGLANPEDAYERFALTMAQVDTRAMLERQCLVASKPKHYWVLDEKEAA